jgi:hypothetical protein
MTDTPRAAFLDTAEGERLRDPDWRRWGPYLSDRQWGTVREDYSANGDAWDSFPHDHARSRAYRWGEDGIGGFANDRLHWCLSVALWNGHDSILKERLFGLTNSEGNHGEDVKELYYYLDGVPTHSFMRMVYKYPQAAFPYERLVEENARRSREETEFELLDTGLFDEQRYFDVEIVYAKAGIADILMRVAVTNRGPDAARLTVIPQLWARNTWTWYSGKTRPVITATGARSARADHPRLETMQLDFETATELMFCENETNRRRLYNEGPDGFWKDAFDRRVVHGEHDAVNPARVGSKCGALHEFEIAAGATVVVRARFRDGASTEDPFSDFEDVVRMRAGEADRFYEAVQAGIADEDKRRVQRQAFAGMLWSKQFYYYDVREWLLGDAVGPTPPATRLGARNSDWQHFRAADVFSMPDAWEYPWFASWDLALQCLVFSAIDPEFAKNQMLLLLHEWYMHPNAALPAYEWSFSDANPPLHAWAAWRVFEADRRINGTPDYAFLRRIFRKLSMNFTWWVNRKDASGRNIFQGGFLGLDNIGLFDRSAPLPTGGTLSQSDGTAWMAMYAIDLLRMAAELALIDHTYDDMATKFFDHFLLIAKAAAESGGLWDETDAFFYDVLDTADGQAIPIRTRTIVGLIPMFAVAVLSMEDIARLPPFKGRMDWLMRNRPDLAKLVSRWNEPGSGETILLSLLRGHRLKKLLARMLDPDEFLSDYGVRAVSKVHGAAPYRFAWDGQTFELGYEPGESRTGLFGGNSNWRGPVWMPINFMLVESLRRFHEYYGNDFQVDLPYAPGRTGSLAEIADELSRRLARIFERGPDGGRRPVHGDAHLAQTDPNFRDHVLFYEYFHGDDGRGLGASHQTGWTGLIALLLAGA